MITHFSSRQPVKLWKVSGANVIEDTYVQSYVSGAGIHWRFIVELAPWIGGYYERLVGIVKLTLRKSLGRQLLTLIQMQTLLRELKRL